MRLLALLALGATLVAGDADDAHRPPHRQTAAVAALRCGSATYSCRAAADASAAVPSVPSVCVNLCIKGAEPPKSPVPEGACGPPCTYPAEACVLAARAAAAKGQAPYGGESADDGGSVLPALPLTHADFEATFEGLRSSQACPLVVE